MAASLADQLAEPEALLAGLEKLHDRVPAPAGFTEHMICLKTAGAIMFIVHKMCDHETPPTTTDNAKQFKDGLEHIGFTLDELIKNGAKLAEQQGGFGEGENEVYGAVGDAYDHVFDMTWRKWQSNGPTRAVSYFISEMQDLDVPVEFDSIADALENIPTATSNSYAVVATKLKVLPPIPPPGRGPHEWGKRSGMYTAEIVHILNENLIIIAEKLDKYHQLVIGEKRKRDDEDDSEED